MPCRTIFRRAPRSISPQVRQPTSALAISPVAFFPLARNIKLHTFPALRWRSRFPPRCTFTRPSLSLLLSSSFLFSFCNAGRSGPSFADSSFTAHFLQRAAYATNTSTSLATLLAPRYTTRQPPAHARGVCTTNLKVSCIYTLFPTNCLTMSRILKAALVLALVAPSALAQTAVQCGGGQQCPSDLPCCSRKPLTSN